MGEIKPIQTRYKCCHFRSRLEARWAVYFDSLNVKWEYEPEGFDLGDGLHYLPDFRVDCWGTRGKPLFDKPFHLYIEVKGEMTEQDLLKIERFWAPKDAPSISGYPVLVVGSPSVYYDYDWCNAPDPLFNYRFIDGDYFGAWPAADDRGRLYLWGAEGSYCPSEDKHRIEKAVSAALSARFEYGECGST